jgi:uncharacterized protein (DUF1684 family)
VTLTLLDWRRRVFDLYRDVRAATDPRAAHARWCDVRRDLFRHHPDSPLPVDARADDPGPLVAPYDPAFRFELAVEGAPPERVEIPTSTNRVIAFDRIGRLSVPGFGSVDVWWLLGYGGGLFVPFKDATAGTTSYGGGRYLLDTVKGADLGGGSSHLVVDFNFAYNPSCAYSPEWSCPLPPAGNVVAATIPVGEQVRAA